MLDPPSPLAYDGYPSIKDDLLSWSGAAVDLPWDTTTIAGGGEDAYEGFLQQIDLEGGRGIGAKVRQQ